MGHGGTEFFHLTGLSKARLLMCFEYSKGHHDFCRGKDKIQNFSSTSFAQDHIAGIICDKVQFEKNANEKQRTWVSKSVFHLHTGTVLVSCECQDLEVSDSW